MIAVASSTAAYHASGRAIRSDHCAMVYDPIAIPPRKTDKTMIWA